MPGEGSPDNYYQQSWDPSKGIPRGTVPVQGGGFYVPGSLPIDTAQGEFQPGGVYSQSPYAIYGGPGNAGAEAQASIMGAPGALPNPNAQAWGAPPAAAGAGAGAGAGAPVDPFTQLVNMILRSQLTENLGKYFYPTSAMPGAGSAFTPGQTAPGGLPQPTGMLPGGGVGAPAPSGGFTPGTVGPNMSTYFNPPSQSPLPTPTSFGQGPAGINQGWLQFLGGLGLQGLPQPSMAGGGSLLMGG